MPDPTATANSCGAPTTSTFSDSDGFTEIDREQSFPVPAGSGATRLNFAAGYPGTGVTWPFGMEVALIDPSGTLTGCSLPQGVGNYSDTQISDPEPGGWTAVFETLRNGQTGGYTEVSGSVNWRATTRTASGSAPPRPAGTS